MTKQSGRTWLLISDTVEKNRKRLANFTIACWPKILTSCISLSIGCHFWRNIRISCKANSFLLFYFACWTLGWLEFVKLPHQRLQLCLSLLRISPLNDSVSDRKGAATDQWRWRSSLTSQMVLSLRKTNTPLVLGVSPQTRVGGKKKAPVWRQINLFSVLVQKNWVAAALWPDSDLQSVSSSLCFFAVLFIISSIFDFSHFYKFYKVDHFGTDLNLDLVLIIGEVFSFRYLLIFIFKSFRCFNVQLRYKWTEHGTLCYTYFRN